MVAIRAEDRVTPGPLIGPDVVASWAPLRRLRVSEWADLHRRLPETSAARGGQWHTETTPYLRGIMDAVHEPGVRTIVVMKAAQVGGSEALHNILGYRMQYDPSPMLIVHPTMHVAEAWSKERLADMIRSTPALREVVQDKRISGADGRPESTLALKMFPGGFLAIAGANSPASYSRWSVRLAIGDDVDRFPPVVGDEGDPSDLLVNRTRSFFDALILFASTPTLRGGRIETLYQRSDQRRYVVVCPGCGRADFITWNDPTHFRVVFDERDPKTARLECPDDEHGGCGARIDEAARRRVIAAGIWKPLMEAQDRGSVGFHVPEMISTLGDVSLPQLVEKWLAARAKGRESLRVFINTSLAEGWEDRDGLKMDPHPLYARREDYGDGVEVPAEAAGLTAGVDVQLDGFYLEVVAWGPALERWAVDWRMIPGDPRQAETRAALLQWLGLKYRHAAGVDLPIHAVCIDSGYATEEIYDFVLAHQARRIYAAKGFAGKSGEPIVMKASDKTYGRVARPVRLYPINVDDAKAEIMASLALPVPGPGSFHFPTRAPTIDEEYFSQLVSEHREPRYSKGRIPVATHYVWIQDRVANHALDCAVLALAAFKLLNPNLRDMAERIRQAAASAASAPAGPQAPPEQPKPTSRRGVRSSYLSTS